MGSIREISSNRRKDLELAKEIIKFVLLVLGFIITALYILRF